MSAQTRYRTLVHNISRVYSSPDAGRTELLQAGIDEIVGVMSPATAPQWRLVQSDTERLLRVWSAKEGDSAVAKVMTDQIVGLLEELSFATAPAPANTVTNTVNDRITHVNPTYPSLIVEEFAFMSVLTPPSTPVVTVTKADEDEVASMPASEDDEQDEEEDDASVPASEEDAAAEAEAEAEAEEEEEVVEPEEEEVEEEEEAGMEVEQVMIRGRTYWKDTNTNKLYAVVRGEDGEDDVGDEVGVLENGKPRFLAK